MSNTRTKLLKRAADLVAMRRVLPAKDFAIEAKLAESRWYAYSFMSPVEATAEFARAYIAGLKRYVRRNDSLELVDKVSGVRVGIPMQRTAQFTQLWRARQKADEYGVPYEVLFDFGFDFAGRRKRKRFPLPHQIFHTDASHDAWWNMFLVNAEELSELAMRQLDMPHYRLEHNRGLPNQRSFQQWIKEDLETSTRNPVDHIGWISVKNRYLSQEECLSVFPPERTQDIRDRLTYEVEAGRIEPEPTTELEDVDFLIGCFGISEAIKAPESNCDACPLRKLCEDMAGLVMRATEKRTGHVSPESEADLERNRRNVAACRARKKAAALAAASAPT
jgi:hypothetical protein